MSILDILRSDGSIVINKHLAHKIGLIDTVILAELISQYLYYEKLNQLDEDGFFYNTIEKLEKETSLKRSAQDAAIARLEKLGLIKKEQRGMPSKRHFTIYEDAIERLVLESRVATKVVEKQQPSSDADSEPKKPKKPRKIKVVENAQPSLQDIDEHGGLKTTTNNNNYNLYLLEEEEEEDSPAKRESTNPLFEHDFQKLRKEYTEYEEVVENIITQAKKDNRPIFAEEEFFLEQASSVEVHPQILLSVYEAVRPEIDRTSKCPDSASLIHNVFQRYDQALRRGRITYDPAKWVQRTWANERLLIEQNEMRRKKG